MQYLTIIAIAFILISVSDTSLANSKRVNQLFNRVAGHPLLLSDPRFKEVESLLLENKTEEAAKVATRDDGFYNVTIRHWASALSDRGEDPLAAFNDFTAMVIGTVRDDRDFREILSGDFTYVGPEKIGGKSVIQPSLNNMDHYRQLETLGSNFAKDLIRQEPQGRQDSAGVLTSHAWGEAHLNMGTNRRAIEYSFREFLCTPIEFLADASVPDSRVHRDVDRSPGGNSSTYQSTCRSCHGGLDSLVGAYAYYRYGFVFIPPFIPTTLNDYPKIQRKMNQNGNVYPEGYITSDDTWINQWTKNHNADLGWRGTTRGKGIRSFGQMLSNSRAFSNCMARRIFTQMCFREPDPSEKELIQSLGTQFEKTGYKLKSLFEKASVLPNCFKGNGT